MPSIMPYNGGDLMGLASSAGSAVGSARGSRFGPWDAASQAFREGVMPAIQKRKKIEENLQIVNSIVSTHPGLEKDPDFGFVLGAAHSGGDMDHAIQIYNQFRAHKEQQDALNKSRAERDQTDRYKAETDRMYKVGTPDSGYEPDGMGPPSQPGVTGKLGLDQNRDALHHEDEQDREAGRNLRATMADKTRRENMYGGVDPNTGNAVPGTLVSSARRAGDNARNIDSEIDHRKKMEARPTGTGKQATEEDAQAAESKMAAKEAEDQAKMLADALKSRRAEIMRRVKNKPAAMSNDEFLELHVLGIRVQEAEQTVHAAQQRLGSTSGAAVRSHIPKPAAAGAAPHGDIVDIAGDEDYAQLPSGAKFRGPDGKVRVKP